MKQDRKFELILYPDSNSYDCDSVMTKAKAFFTHWAYILHDKDIEEDGVTPKKAHIHFIGKRDTIITPKGVCYHLGIQEPSLSNIKSWKAAVRYLIHADDDSKAQYDVEDIESNFELEGFMLESKRNEDEEALQIYKFIVTNDNLDFNQIMFFIMTNNYWSTFRRGFAVWDTLIRESRSKYKKKGVVTY